MKKMKLLSWNVNGLRAVSKKGFVKWLQKEKPDVICIQETRVSNDEIPENLRKIRGYHSFFSEPYRKGYSGVGIYSKVKPGKVKSDIGIERFDREGRVLIADYKKFILLNIYFPNGGFPGRLQYKLDFYDAFLKFVNKLKKKGKKIVVCGDVNTAHKKIDLARPERNQFVSGFLPQERKWIDKFLKNGFVDTFRMFNKEPKQYTWWDMKTKARERNVGWRIDYFFVSKNLEKNLKNAYILPEVKGSDHCPVGIELLI